MLIVEKLNYFTKSIHLSFFCKITFFPIEKAGNVFGHFFSPELSNVANCAFATSSRLWIVTELNIESAVSIVVESGVSKMEGRNQLKKSPSCILLEGSVVPTRIRRPHHLVHVGVLNA